MMVENNEMVVQESPTWMKANRYMQLTGHTSDTLKKLRLAGHLKRNRHYKYWPEGSMTIYYNQRAIDNLISLSKG